MYSDDLMFFWFEVLSWLRDFCLHVGRLKMHALLVTLTSGRICGFTWNVNTKHWTISHCFVWRENPRCFVWRESPWFFKQRIRKADQLNFSIPWSFFLQTQQTYLNFNNLLIYMFFYIVRPNIMCSYGLCLRATKMAYGIRHYSN